MRWESSHWCENPDAMGDAQCDGRSLMCWDALGVLQVHGGACRSEGCD